MNAAKSFSRCRSLPPRSLGRDGEIRKSTVTVGTGRTAAPYDRTRKYRRGQAMMHNTFGHGEVTAVFESKRIDVAFGDGTRRLIHDQQQQQQQQQQ